MSILLRSSSRTRLQTLARDGALIINQQLNRYQTAAWLLGDGRSGTTWVSSLINHDARYREMFEPFHPQQIASMSALSLHQYARPGEPNPMLSELAGRVFEGRFRHPRVDQENRTKLYHGLIIKDIFANLFAYWACQAYPHIKPILLLRNPFSVALSKRHKKHWHWMTDPLQFLQDRKLLDDHLRDSEEIIRRTCETDDFILKQILIWCIINQVPLRQFSSDRLLVVLYENVVRDPNGETRRILQHLEPTRRLNALHIKSHLINQPSRVSQAPANKTFAGHASQWKDQLPAKTIDAGMRLLEHFGFDQCYTADDDGERRFSPHAVH